MDIEYFVDDLSYPAPEDDEKFEQAIGKLTIAWATVEYELYYLLTKYSGVDQKVGRALFGGNRATDMIDKIRNIADNNALDKAIREDLEYIFSHIRSINTMRDKIVHHSIIDYDFDPLEPSKRLITDEFRNQRISSKAFKRIVDADMIFNMCHDLYEILNLLNPHIWLEKENFKPHTDFETGKRNKWLYQP